jgi:hypothetical protein
MFSLFGVFFVLRNIIYCYFNILGNNLDFTPIILTTVFQAEIDKNRVQKGCAIK